MALLEDCLKAVYRQAGIREEEPGTWVKEMPHLGDLERELQARMAAAPKEGRLRRMKTKLSPLFDWRIFSKPDIPLRPSRLSGETKTIRVDFSKLPAALVNFSDSHQWHRIQVGRVDA